MSRLSFVLFIGIGLLLTVYFGAAAWRVTADRPIDITGQIR